MHAEVGVFLNAHDLGALEPRMTDMGIYTHEDLVNISVDIRDQKLRQKFKTGLGVSDEVWRTLKKALYRYARPIPVRIGAVATGGKRVEIL